MAGATGAGDRERGPERFEDWAARAIGLAEGELPRAARLVALIFLVSASLVILKSAQNGIFLNAYPKTMIPKAFFASAALLSTTSMALVPLAGRLGAARLAVRSIVACAAVCFALRAMLYFEVRHAAFLLYPIIETMAGVLLIQGWAVVSQATTPRSAKRLLPIAGVGATVAWALFGLLVPVMAHRLGAATLLYVAPGLLLGGAFLVVVIRRNDLPKASTAPRKRSIVGEWKSAFAFVRRMPLMRVMMALSVLALLTEQLMDLLLMSAAHERFPTEDSSTAFFGRYYGITSGVTLVFVLLFSSRILLGLGTARSLLLTPVLTLFAVAGVLVVPGFATIVILRAVDRVLKQSVWSSASEQTQTPLPPIERVQSRALVRGVIAPAFYAAMALTLALIPRIPGTRALAAATFVGISVMGVVCLVAVRRAYRDALRRAIDERTFDFDAVPTARLDDEMRRVLGIELAGSDERRASLAAELLCEGDAAPPPDVLRTALASSFEHVRIAALDAIAKHRLAGFARDCARLLPSDSSADCQRHAARALSAIEATNDEARAALVAIANTKDHPAQAAAAVALALTDARSKGRAMGLADLLRGPEDVAEEALEVLRREGFPEAERADVVGALRTILVADGTDERKIRAVETAARLRATPLLPQIAGLLGTRIGPDVAEHLVAWGDEALRYVRETVEDASAESVRHVASALGALSVAGEEVASAPSGKGENAVKAGTGPLLERLLSHEDPEVRVRAARSLAYATRRGLVPHPDDARIAPLLDRELALAYRLYAILAGLARDDGIPDWKIDPPYDHLGAEIEREVGQARQRVLHLLALTGRHRLVSAVEAGLRRESAEVDAKIAELVDATLARDLAKRVVPLFERLSLREKAECARQFADGVSEVERDPLAAIVQLGNAELIGKALLVYQDRFRDRYPRLADEYASLLPLFERMAFLRTVPLFEEMPGAELRRVAEMLSSVQVREGETIFKKGDPGDDLFLVRSGLVSIRDGAIEIGTAKSQEFFGELALLDNEPRSADAVASQMTELLRLRSADFRELMARRPQIQEQIVRVLVRRIREATGRVTRNP
ncbi:hypothetical protein BH09MYX1_BH09MYX1_26500 [soil metagenome]